MTKVRGTGESIQMDEDWFVRRDGSMFPVSYTSTPIDMPDGPGVVVAFKDIEEQRAAEQALREREAILAKVGQPVWVTDQAGCFHYANPAALAALGYDEVSDLVGQPAHDLVHYKYPDGTPFPEDDCPLVRAREAGETLQDTDDWLVRKDGSIVRVTYSSAPFDLPDGLGSVTAFSDVEEQRRAEQAARERDVAEARAAELRVARAAHHRGRGRGARAARARPARRRAAAVRQRPAAAAAGRAQGVVGSRAGARAARAGDRAGQRRGSPSCAASRPASTRRSSPTAAWGRRCRRSPPAAARGRVVDTPAVRLPAPVEASVYFFVSEALTNVVKHAQAREATVSIAADDGALTVEVGDDGVGGAQAGGGSGLRGLGDRIGALDGTLEVESPPGGGTVLRARIPLTQLTRGRAQRCLGTTRGRAR